eukprot:135600_1
MRLIQIEWKLISLNISKTMHRIKKDKNDLLQSSIFSNNNNDNNNKDGIFLDKFTWWKVTRASNRNKAIDAETATDAISPNNNHNNDRRRTQSSFRIIPNKNRRASSLF